MADFKKLNGYFCKDAKARNQINKETYMLTINDVEIGEYWEREEVPMSDVINLKSTFYNTQTGYYSFKINETLLNEYNYLSFKVEINFPNSQPTNLMEYSFKIPLQKYASQFYGNVANCNFRIDDNSTWLIFANIFRSLNSFTLNCNNLFGINNLYGTPTIVGLPSELDNYEVRIKYLQLSYI